MNISFALVQPILYSYWRSSCAYRVRIALDLKGIAYEYRAVNLGASSEQFSDEYKLINPMQQVPSFQFENNGKKHTLIQSVAILEFLEQMYPEPALYTKDAIQNAHIRSICETIASGIQPLQNLESLRLVGVCDKPNTEFAKFIVEKKFHSLEALLKQHAGQYCFGNQLTMADLFLVPQVYNAKRFSIDLTKFPTIKRLSDYLEQLPAFVKASPEQQPDAPK